MVASTSSSASSSANLFRRLTWQATIPLCIRLAEGTPGAADGGVYYMHAPRHTYLALLLPEIRENLVAVALAAADLDKTDEREWWFEEEGAGVGADGVGQEGGFERQGPIKWHHPLDLVQLLSLISTPLPPPPSSSSPSPVAQPPPLLRLILHLSNPPTDRLFLPSPLPTTTTSTSSAPRAPSGNPTSGADLLAETARSAWLNSTKAADFARYRSTVRVTGLRRAEIEAAWEAVGGPSAASGASGLLDVGGAGAGGGAGGRGEWEAFGRLVGKVWPLPVLPVAGGSGPGATTETSGASGVSRPPSTDPAPGGKQPDSAYSVRAVPVRVYLPDGAPVIQEVAAPLQADGKPTTLLAFLHTHLPLLFPLPSATADDPRSPHPHKAEHSSSEAYPLAVPLVQGVEVPPESELAWLSACVCGVDGWLRVGVRLRAA